MDTDDFVYNWWPREVWDCISHNENDVDESRESINDNKCLNLDWPKKDEIDRDPAFDLFERDISPKEMCTHLSYFHPSSESNVIIRPHLLS